MSRPDARLLVPVECLPSVPNGAPVWHARKGRGTVFDRDDLIGELYLDLSAPALRDGVPERLDALGWALGLLRRGVDGIHMDEDGSAVLTDCGEPVLAYNDPASRHMRCTIDEDLAPWPDLSGLSPDDASRAVVAAALRGGR